MVFPPYFLAEILQRRRRRLQRELILVGILCSILLSGKADAIFNKLADALPQGQGVMIAWTIGPYAMKIKNMELLAVTTMERISQGCSLAARSGGSGLAPGSKWNTRKKASQKQRA